MKNYVIIYKNGDSEDISKLDALHLQELEEGICKIYDVTNTIKKVK